MQQYYKSRKKHIFDIQINNKLLTINQEKALILMGKMDQND